MENAGSGTGVSFVIKYTVPTRYDAAPQGTIWKVTGEQGDELYMQASDDPSAANWQKIETILGKVFEDYLQDQQFMSTCLNLFCKTGDKATNLAILSTIIQK
jgi:hypothetical protein